MRENVGGADRIARAVIGPALMVLGYGGVRDRQGTLLGALSLVAGTYLAQTALSRVCPVNEALGVDTARRIQVG
jgi:hypothetical protein